MISSFNQDTRSLVVEIPDLFIPYAASAALRIQGLYPDLSISFDDAKIKVLSVSAEQRSKVLADVCHHLYRERIYGETLDLRRSLLSAVIK
ncbi:hypothetical protein U2P60_19640 [Brucella sp. H1_1004]|uniref:hypothetical protein n=1 Tax=Brucella sp. H1_1004 TaxID=3110109 RepID=UPI0039B6096E